VRVWLLDGGTLVIDHSQLMWNINPGVEVRFPVYSVLVEHDDGLFLFDTGYDREHTERVLPFELPQQAPEQTIPAQLRLCGFEPGDVSTLVNSHLHFDHCGANRLVPDARVVIHEREIAQARDPEPFERIGYSDATWDHERARFEPISGDVELAPGLRLYETPGHSIGHYALLVSGRSDRRPMLFPFDVALSREAFEKGVQASFHIDPVAGVRSIARVKALADEHGADLFYAHDAEEWAGYRQAPDHYEV
jgi:4-pyridoxolactonase